MEYEIFLQCTYSIDYHKKIRLNYTMWVLFSYFIKNVLHEIRYRSIDGLI